MLAYDCQGCGGQPMYLCTVQNDRKESVTNGKKWALLQTSFIRTRTYSTYQECLEDVSGQELSFLIVGPAKVDRGDCMMAGTALANTSSTLQGRDPRSSSSRRPKKHHPNHTVAKSYRRVRHSA
eukprot:34186-Amphidinium_carterae.1